MHKLLCHTDTKQKKGESEFKLRWKNNDNLFIYIQINKAVIILKIFTPKSLQANAPI